jgi:hypothetical protein
MKTIETALYSYDELSDSAKARIIAREAENAEIYYEDMQASLKAVCGASGLRLLDYSYGPDCRNHKVRVSGNTEDMEGHKALAWFLRVLIDAGYSRPPTFAEMTFPGICGFTGVCFDDLIAESVWRSLLEGCNVRDAFDGVSSTLCKSCEDELAYLQSEEWILESLDQTAEIYTEEGEEF